MINKKIGNEKIDFNIEDIQSYEPAKLKKIGKECKLKDVNGKQGDFSGVQLQEVFKNFHMDLLNGRSDCHCYTIKPDFLGIQFFLF